MSAALQLEGREMSIEELRAKVELTVEESAFYLGISRRTFYNSWKSRGLDAVEDHRGMLLFRRVDLEHHMKQRRKVRRGYR